MTRDEPNGETLAADIPFKHVYLVETLAKSGRDHAVSVEASAAERTAIAEFLDLEAVETLVLTGTLAREGRAGWRFDGQLEAQAAQRCVVTLEPVPTAISELINRHWSPDAKPPQAEDAVFGLDSELDEEPPEPLGAEIDLGAVAVETLALALDPYPRAPGADLDATRAAPPGVAPLTDEAVKPFAGLAALRERMGAANGAAPETEAEGAAAQAADEQDDDR